MEELNGYKDPENRRKAEKVRKLMKIGVPKFMQTGIDTELQEARQLSGELVNYLKNKYPDNFRSFTFNYSTNNWMN